jgi:hypothetical protein
VEESAQDPRARRRAVPRVSCLHWETLVRQADWRMKGIGKPK